MLRRVLAKFLRKPRRQIYRYWNGVKWITADPLELWFRLREAPFDWDRALEEADAGGRAEIDRLIDHIGKSFETARYDGRTKRGLTLLEHVDLLQEFMGYLDRLKKMRESGPMESQPSAPGASSLPPETSAAPMSSTSASGSSGSESSAAGPGG